MMARRGVLASSARPMVYVYYPFYQQNWMPPAQYFDWSAATHIGHYNVEPNDNGTLRAGPTYMQQADRDELIPVAHAHGLKVTLAIGGGGVQSSGFPAATATPALRATLISNLLALVNANGYDGIDLNWEPMTDNTSATLKNQFIALAAELRAALGAGALLTCSSFSAFAPLLAAAMNESISHFMLQGYGMWAPYDAGETETWHHTALFNGGIPQVSDGRELHSVEFMLNKYSAIPQNKLVVGVGAFGIVWSGGTGTPTGGVTAPRQQWTTLPTYEQASYGRILERSDFATTQLFDTVARVPYLSRNTGTDATDQFVSYDNPASFREKVAWTAGRHIGGSMVWAAGDDFIPAASGADAKTPLLTAIRDEYVTQYGRRPTIITPHTPSYTPNAVVFNGSTYANKTTAYTGAADSKRWTGAMLIKLHQRNTIQRVMRANANNYAVTVLDTWHLQLQGRTAAFVDCLVVQSSVQLNLNTWYTVYWSFDLADPIKRHIIINGVDRTGIVTTYDAAANINFNVGQNAIGAVHTGIQPFFGELAELWMMFGHYAAPTEPVLRKFFDLHNRVVDKGSDGSTPFNPLVPHVFFRGSTAGWLTNKGSGGSPSDLLVGTLGTSAEPPAGA